MRKSPEEKPKKKRRRAPKQDLERITGEALERMLREKLPEPAGPADGPPVPLGDGEFDFEP